MNTPNIPSTTSDRRSTSKIARLPKRLRNQINEMMEDGLTYAEILRQLGDPVEHLNCQNLSDWHKSGHQAWRKDQAWLHQMQGNLDFASQVLQSSKGLMLHEASLRIAVKQMFGLLANFDPCTFADKLADDPAAYVRILHTLVKLSETALKYQCHHADQAQYEEEHRPRKRRGLSEKTRRIIEEELNLRSHFTPLDDLAAADSDWQANPRDEPAPRTPGSESRLQPAGPNPAEQSGDGGLKPNQGESRPIKPNKANKCDPAGGRPLNTRLH